MAVPSRLSTLLVVSSTFRPFASVQDQASTASPDVARPAFLTSAAAVPASIRVASANRAVPVDDEADADGVGVDADGTVVPPAAEDEGDPPPCPSSHPPAAPTTATASSPA